MLTICSIIICVDLKLENIIQHYFGIIGEVFEKFWKE